MRTTRVVVWVVVVCSSMLAQVQREMPLNRAAKLAAAWKVNEV